MRNLELLYALTTQVLTVTKINPLQLQLNETRMDDTKLSHTAVGILRAARERIDAVEAAKQEVRNAMSALDLLTSDERENLAALDELNDAHERLAQAKAALADLVMKET